MPLQYDAKITCTLVTGKSGSGKTTFALRYLVSERNFTTRFIFDYRGEFSARLKLPPAETVEELPCAAEEGFCIFAPGTMFPGRLPEAFAFFCKWAFDYSFHLPGRKLLLIDEVWKYCSPHKIPTELAEVIQEGRKHGLETMFMTQRPHMVNGVITNEVTELVCFKLAEPAALERIEFFGVDIAEIQALPKGTFVAVNVDDDGAELRGALWGRAPKRRK
jgi:hypothetical protein